MKAKMITPVLLAVSLLTLSSCHKTCTCYGFDSTEKTYSSDEVDARNSSCEDMRYIDGITAFSYCSWD